MSEGTRTRKRTPVLIHCQSNSLLAKTVKMPINDIWTPEEILAERAAEAAAGRLAHSANSSGFFWARPGCPCYNCKNSEDPTGELEASERNAGPQPAPEPASSSISSTGTLVAEEVQKSKTPEEVLAERQEQRTANVLAHSAKVDGDFMARYGCPCYNCRDFLDPTGEEDATATGWQSSSGTGCGLARSATNAY